MGLTLHKDRNGKYIRSWYAVMIINGKRTTRTLKTPLRGRIPTDEFGAFSLNLKGDAAFEKSKADALAELNEENAIRRDGGADARRNAEVLGLRTIRLSCLADENAKRKKYALIEGTKEYKYNKSVYDILTHFVKWNDSRPRKRSSKRYYFLSDVDGDLVREYYAVISKSQSWQTFRKYVFTLKSVFKNFTSGTIPNPFEMEYAEYKGKRSEFGDKDEIAHKPPSTEQMMKAWKYAKSKSDKPYLHRLAVLAACTGLRIGDCCNLTWDKVDLQGGVIKDVKTKKTGAVVSVPMFDYNPKGRDYNPIFGELRRELEAALAEREEGAIYVVPEAAKIYGYNPSRITKEGKDIFAHAISEDATSDVTVIDEEKEVYRNPIEVLKQIDSANFAPSKKERIRRVYEMFVIGKSYRQISEIIGKPKSTISEDLAAVETLIGKCLRKGSNLTANRNNRLELIGATRQNRGQGRRAACLYGWHSCRMFFVGYAFYEIGMSETELIGITGHSTVKMVRHYIETSGSSAVLAAKRKNAARNYRHSSEKRGLHNGTTAGTAETLIQHQDADLSSNGVIAIANAVQAVLADASLTPETKNAVLIAIAGANSGRYLQQHHGNIVWNSNMVSRL